MTVIDLPPVKRLAAFQHMKRIEDIIRAITQRYDYDDWYFSSADVSGAGNAGFDLASSLREDFPDAPIDDVMNGLLIAASQVGHRIDKVQELAAALTDLMELLLSAGEEAGKLE